jgi:threonine synthase
MKYYSTNKNTPEVTLKEAVIKGLAADNGLFMPERILKFEPVFFENIHKISFRDIAFEVALKFFGEDVEESSLREIVNDTLTFDCPVVKIMDDVYSLELFHGPTLAFKDVGARFMARLLNYFLEGNRKPVHVLVATSGDTGSAVANGFLGVEGIHVHVLYPKGKVSKIQESQFTTLGRNITALEVEGTFDDCQHLVKTAFLDEELNKKLQLTSANSINVARFLPQAFYYFNAYARLKEQGALDNKEFIVSVPSGNFGNLTAGLFAHKMGLPVAQFLAANNENDVVHQYLQSGKYNPRPSVETIANAMDVGSPSNFARILNLYDHSHIKISSIIKGFKYSDQQIRETIRKLFDQTGYLCDPHGACGFMALQEYMEQGQVGVFLETAHPAKFKETVEQVVGYGAVELPDKLASFMNGQKQSVAMSCNYADFREYFFCLK